MRIGFVASLLGAVVCASMMGHVQAQPSTLARGKPDSSQPKGSDSEVVTRAIVRSVFQEDSGKRQYIRLKLIPGGKIPFSTLTYRVMDAALVAGLREGDSVAFRAERQDGENVLTAIRAVPPCQRFQRCE